MTQSFPPSSGQRVQLAADWSTSTIGLVIVPGLTLTAAAEGVARCTVAYQNAGINYGSVQLLVNGAAAGPYVPVGPGSGVATLGPQPATAGAIVQLQFAGSLNVAATLLASGTWIEVAPAA